jgi:hypothetical protein
MKNRSQPQNIFPISPKLPESSDMAIVMHQSFNGALEELKKIQD